MSRYIDADALVIDYYDDYETKDDVYTYRYVSESQIDSAPSIDIVRCGECKHRKPSGYVGFVKTYECDITGLRMHDLTNHFCSYGEREGE